MALALIGGGYLFIMDQRNKATLSTLEEAKEVESTATTSSATVASQVVINRTNGEWDTNSTGGNYGIVASELKFEFTGYKPGGQHVGTFNNLVATVSLDAMGNPIATEITIDPKSVQTDAAGVTGHLQKKEFFDTETFADVKVNIKEIQKEGANVKAIADLTIKGVTKTLAIPVTVTKTEAGTKFEVDTRIKISDYGMAYGPVQDEVRVTLSGLVFEFGMGN